MYSSGFNSYTVRLKNSNTKPQLVRPCPCLLLIGFFVSSEEYVINKPWVSSQWCCCIKIMCGWVGVNPLLKYFRFVV